MKLTKAQEEMLAEVKKAGVKTYNGRAAKTIKALENAGLVTVYWDMRAQIKGGGMELVQEITVTPVTN